MVLATTTPEAVDMSKLNQIGMLFMKAVYGQINVMESMQKRVP